VPKILMLACVALAGALLVKAGLAPFYEVGLPRFTTPLLACGMVLLVVLFMARRRWTWYWVMWTAVIFPLMSIVFPPGPEAFGALTTTARSVAFVEGIASLVILGFLSRSETRRWFFGSLSVQAAKE
jgi:hypothetical protein